MCFRAVFVLAAMLAAAPAAAQDMSARTRSIGPALWAGGLQAVDAAAAREPAFVIAMVHYRHTALAGWKDGSYPLLASNGSASGDVLLWVARDGSHVAKVRQGLFRLTMPEGGSGLFRSVDCHAGEWPDFACSDGRKRSMSVPSHTRLVFGRVAYERLAPPGR